MTCSWVHALPSVSNNVSQFGLLEGTLHGYPAGSKVPPPCQAYLEHVRGCKIHDIDGAHADQPIDSMGLICVMSFASSDVLKIGMTTWRNFRTAM